MAFWLIHKQSLQMSAMICMNETLFRIDLKNSILDKFKIKQTLQVQGTW